MSILCFEALHSSVDVEFWFTLKERKLHEFKLDNSPKPIHGFLLPGKENQSHLSSRFYLTKESFQKVNKKWEKKNSENLYQLQGSIQNANTFEEFRKFKKYEILKEVASKLLKQIKSGEWIEQELKNGRGLNEFLLLSFADLKKHRFHYWFCFPAILPSSAFQFSKEMTNVSSVYDKKILLKLDADFDDLQRQNCDTYKRGANFFLILDLGDKGLIIKNLEKDLNFGKDVKNIYFGFIDSSTLKKYPNWILRNYLLAIGVTWKLKQVKLWGWRESGSYLLNVALNIDDKPFLPNKLKCSGWEKNKDEKNLARRVDLGFMMDPMKLAQSSVALNLQLMKWRMYPNLDLQAINSQKCLLLGSGTLGCQVSRNLIAWGIYNITFVDRGNVSFSNPVRQPLFEYEDCLEGGKLKAKCAADHLKKIYPLVNANSYNIDIPMPGHIVTKKNLSEVKKNVGLLEKLIKEHDVIFLLTDTRESRWLPSVIGAKHKKIVLTSALGFDSFVVMRHGVYSEGNKLPHLGCYFCNDVVAPVNSTKDRTLDQQCTVTRPGTSALAGGIAVELLISLLNHPKKKLAPGSKPNEKVSQKEFGLVPHQIRGSLSSFQNMIFSGSSYNQCTACSPRVVNEYVKKGFSFLLKVFNKPNHLEDITGLTELFKKTEEEYNIEPFDDKESEDGFSLL